MKFVDVVDSRGFGVDASPSGAGFRFDAFDLKLKHDVFPSSFSESDPLLLHRKTDS